MQPCISMLLNILLNILMFKISTVPQFTETLFSFQTIQFSLSEAWLPGVYGNEALVLVSWFYLLFSLLSDSSGPGKSTDSHMHADLSDMFWLKLSGTFWIVLKLFYWQICASTYVLKQLAKCFVVIKIFIMLHIFHLSVM